MTPRDDRSADVVIVGAGIAGASAAYFLAAHRRVILLEREAQPGYHTTGRSAALFSEAYGNATVRALTRASREFFASPPAGFADHPLLSPRGHLIFCRADQKDELDAAAADMAATGTRIRHLTGAQVRSLAPALRDAYAHAGVLDASAEDVDVHALLHGFLRGARAQGARLVTGAELQAAEYSAGRWRLATTAGPFAADVLVNAGGAWSLAPLARGRSACNPCGARPSSLNARTSRVRKVGRWPSARTNRSISGPRPGDSSPRRPTRRPRRPAMRNPRNWTSPG